MLEVFAARVAAQRFHRKHGRRATLDDVEEVSALFSLTDKPSI
jgi:hypothetical protein